MADAVPAGGQPTYTIAVTGRLLVKLLRRTANSLTEAPKFDLAQYISNYTGAWHAHFHAHNVVLIATRKDCV